MYIIIIGAGDIGSQVTELAVAAGHEVVVIEKQEAIANEAASEYDCLVLNEDATSKAALEDAGAEQADAIISTTDEDAVNIMVMILSEELGISNRVSVVHDAEHMEMFRKQGVNVLENPQRLIAEYLFRAVQRPTVKDFMQLAGGAEVFEITVVEDAPIAGHTLAEADSSDLLAEDTLIVAIERNGEVITPKGGTTLKPGDLVTVFSKEGVTDRLLTTFAGEQRGS